MDMTITLAGDARVEVQAGPHTIRTDQPPASTAPTPFTLFLASIGSCAGFYMQAFCRARGIRPDGIRLRQHHQTTPAGVVERVELTVELPDDFPEQYRTAVIKSAETCTVKKHLEHPPAIQIEAAPRVPALAPG
jgi:putative redox protein